MKTWHAAIGIVVLISAVAFAQNRVTANQGKPGNEGPWPVTGTLIVVNTGNDGGFAQVFQYPGQCAKTVADGGLLHKNTVVGVAATNVPASAAPGRLYVEVCNSLQNSGTPYLKCRADGTAPVMAATNAGDVFGIGDCRVYPVPAGNILQCIADAASTNALSYECLPPNGT